jgi:hypothetical protein
MQDVFGLGIDLPDLLPKPKLSGPTIRSSPTPLRVSPGIAPEFRHRKHTQPIAVHRQAAGGRPQLVGLGVTDRWRRL